MIDDKCDFKLNHFDRSFIIFVVFIDLNIVIILLFYRICITRVRFYHVFFQISMDSSDHSSSHSNATYSPLPWSEFGFDEKNTVQVGDDKFNYYRRGNTGPLFFCIHGAGYTGLSFAQLAVSLSYI